MSEQAESRFSNRDDVDQLREYTRLNIVAILSLLLGVLSVGSLVHPNVWIVPLIGVFLGIVGLSVVRRNDNMGGRFAAWTGIALSLFFLSWASTYLIAQRHVIYSEAEEVGKKWLQLVVEGETEIAHQGMLHPASRQASGMSVDDYYLKDEKASEDKQKVFSEQPAAQILGLGGDADIQLIRNLTQDVDLKYGKLILQVYRVAVPGRDPVDVQLTIARSYKEDLGRASWIVAAIEEPG